MKELKSWADLSEHYSMVLFNQCINIEDGAVLNEWFENHTCELEENEECECEAFQWYAISVNESDVNYLKNEFDIEIFYSDTLDLHILPVYHYGTSWNILGLKGGYVNTGL